jgi:peptidoglycan/LPS O-acetylase OafA/YrhL
VTAEIARGRSSGLDGLRAVAALLVVVYHLRLVGNVSFGPLDPFVSGGSMGVWIFFVLSGYLLYRPFVAGRVDLRSYGLKRAARILPGYFVALVALVILTGNRLPFDHPIAYLTITSSYDRELREFLGPAWTLSAEVLFYITLPLIARVAAGRQLTVLLPLAALSVVGSLIQRYTATDATVFRVDAYPLVFFGFVPGMLLAVMETRIPAVFADLAKARYLALGVFLIVVGLLTAPYPLPVGVLLGTPFVVGWLLQHRMPGSRALVFAGGASYALYLWHYDLIRTFGVAGAAIAIVGAALSWALVERPILALAHRRAAAWRGADLANQPVAV